MSSRYRQLDGLRGLAALSVFMSHALGTLDADRLPRFLTNSVLHFFFDGAAAVDFFFVLSGFCLAMPYLGEQARKLEVPDFLVRRVFRIYPAYLIGVAFAFLLRFALFQPQGLHGLSAWVTGLWTTTPTVHNLLGHLLFVGPSFDSHTIDPVIWSLVVEMRMSLLFPAVILAAGRLNTPVGGAAILLASVALGAASGVTTFLPLFVIGALLAQYRRSAIALVQRLAGWQTALVGLAATLFYEIRFSIPTWQPDPNALWVHLTVGAGGAVLIALSMARPTWGAVLTHAVSGFLGDISYSFYLLHLPVLLTVTAFVYGHTQSLLTALAASLVVSIGVAYASKSLIEDASIQLGRKVAGAIWKRQGRVSALESQL